MPTAPPSAHRERVYWTQEEDDKLLSLVSIYGSKRGKDSKWPIVAAALEGRNIKDCRKRYFHSLAPDLKKGRWSKEEDQLLLEWLDKLGPVWYQIAKQIPGRKDDQCAKRWKEVLDPSLSKGLPWTKEEDAELLALYEANGPRWQLIARSIPGRTGLCCRNRWRKFKGDELIASELEAIEEKKRIVGGNAGGTRKLPDGGRGRRAHSQDQDNGSMSAGSSTGAGTAAGESQKKRKRAEDAASRDRQTKTRSSTADVESSLASPHLNNHHNLFSHHQSSPQHQPPFDFLNHHHSSAFSSHHSLDSSRRLPSPTHDLHSHHQPLAGLDASLHSSFGLDLFPNSPGGGRHKNHAPAPLPSYMQLSQGLQQPSPALDGSHPLPGDRVGGKAGDGSNINNPGASTAAGSGGQRSTFDGGHLDPFAHLLANNTTTNTNNNASGDRPVRRQTSSTTLSPSSVATPSQSGTSPATTLDSMATPASDANFVANGANGGLSGAALGAAGMNKPASGLHPPAPIEENTATPSNHSAGDNNWMAAFLGSLHHPGASLPPTALNSPVFTGAWEAGLFSAPPSPTRHLYQHLLPPPPPHLNLDDPSPPGQSANDTRQLPSNPSSSQLPSSFHAALPGASSLSSTSAPGASGPSRTAAIALQNNHLSPIYDSPHPAPSDHSHASYTNEPFPTPSTSMPSLSGVAAGGTGAGTAPAPAASTHAFPLPQTVLPYMTFDPRPQEEINRGPTPMVLVPASILAGLIERAATLDPNGPLLRR